MTLNLRQRAAFEAIQSKKNIFLTGAGGVGKSHVIGETVAWGASTRVDIAVTAMTGCAAVLLPGAKTLHSWSGIGLGRESPNELLDIVLKNKRAVRRWNNAHVLIVDEVSMMTPDILEKLDYIARRVRKDINTRFGGLQLILVGDFCQLPPVSTKMTFLFETPTWSTLIDETHNLTEIIRQPDPVFQTILTEARMGELSDASIAILRSRMNLNWQENDIKPTLLYGRNTDVDKINRENMAALPGERRVYTAHTVTKAQSEPYDARSLEKLDMESTYDITLELCVGAQVMLLVNLDQEHGLVNGSRGIVTGYSPSGLPLVRFVGGKSSVLINTYSWWLDEGVGRSQIPLKIAYAISIHKGQGASLDSALVDIGSNTFTYGQAYVALSRCRSLEGLYIWRFDPKMVICHPKVKQFYATLTDPVVQPIVDVFQTQSLPTPWRSIVEPRIARILANIGDLRNVAPRPEDVFTALRACPDPAAVKVILLGQDPYPTEGNAHGLSFSVLPSVSKLPASLKNIFKELAEDLGVPVPTSGCLQTWADQGVLLLNDTLTVQIGKPLSHSGKGWEELTSDVIASVLQSAPHVVLIVWGRSAHKKLENPGVKPHLSKHTVIASPHPSPLSAHTGFFGSKPFSQTNAALASHGQTPIQWS